jgi:multiple sugar transport system ATP-binding protein
VSFSLPVEKKKVMEKVGQGQMLVGIRPEHLSVQQRAREDMLEGVVKVVEPLGREDLLHIETPFGEFLALNSQGNFKTGQKVGLFFEKDRVHFFEAETDSKA